MSEQNKSRSQNQQTTSRKPLMLGYTVRPFGDGSKSTWSKIAAAWAHKDGEGYEVRLDALPVDGRLVLRTVTDDQQPENEVIDHTPNGLG